MKKLKLDLQNLNAEVLTRSQLKQILGGEASSGGSGNGTTCNSNSKEDCTDSKKSNCYNGAAYSCTNTKSNNYLGVCDA